MFALYEVMRVLGFKLFTTYFVIGRLVLCLSLDESFDNALKHTSIVSKWLNMFLLTSWSPWTVSSIPSVLVYPHTKRTTNKIPRIWNSKCYVYLTLEFMFLYTRMGMHIIWTSLHSDFQILRNVIVVLFEWRSSRSVYLLYTHTHKYMNSKGKD